MSLRRVLSVIENVTSDQLVKTIVHSVNENQEKCKQWLIENCNEYLKLLVNPKIVVLAGWYGNLANRLLKYGNVTSIDIDSNCKMVGEKLYKDVSFDTKNIIDYNTKKYDVVACTSCEHLTQSEFDKVFNNIEKGTLVILQSNNYFEIKDHKNCFNSLQEFVDSVKFEKLLYKGHIDLPKYTRFMVIGVR